MRLYTAEEAAEVLSLSKWTVWKYGREGKLKTVRFGRTVRYDLEGGINEEDTGMDSMQRDVDRVRILHDDSRDDGIGGENGKA